MGDSVAELVGGVSANHHTVGESGGKSPPLAASTDKAGPLAASTRKACGLEDLPLYTRSLLKTKVPVSVILAEQRQPISRILELVPGTIIQFDKSCEEMLDLEVGGHRIARGEAVKVGEKFGLRITAIVRPEERFQPVRPGKK
jgi:flagellar motor switch/type III secretory pathway protein FliN